MFQSLIRTLRTGRRHTRPLLICGGIVIALALLFQVVAPFLISTSLVRESIESAVEDWFGHDATIAGDPQLHFWPRPTIVLEDITIRENDDPTSRVIAHIDRLSASFQLYQALRGRPIFRDFDLVRPHVFARRETDGDIDWSMDGLFDEAVRKVKAAGSDGAELGAALDTAVGDVTVEDGTIEIADVESGRTTTVSALGGTIDWANLSSSLTLRLSGRLKDTTFTVDGYAPQPMALLAGQNGAADIAVTSDLFSGKFSGTANLATYAFLSGSLSLTVPAMSTALDWAGIDVSGMDRLQQVTLNARLMTTGNALRFEQVALQANEASATGIMDLVAPDGDRPRLTGTLAFDRLDFSAILSALSPRPPASGDEAADVAPAALLGDTLDLDLRLSAREAQLGPLPLRHAAVSMMNTQKLARIDLVDSDIDDGRLTGQLSATNGRIADGADLKLSLREADLASVSRRFGAQALVPEAHGSVELALHLAKPLGLATVRDLSGTLRMSAREGRLSGVDINLVRHLAGQSSYFALKDVRGDQLFFDHLDVSASIADGIAEIGEAKLDGPNDLLTVSGLLPLENRGLALSANLFAKTAGVPSGAPYKMFIGGAWPSPVFWPMAPPLP